MRALTGAGEAAFELGQYQLARRYLRGIPGGDTRLVEKRDLVDLIFEITQDYQILVPLMVANMLSFTISKRLQRAPVYNALLQQDGVHLPEAPFGAAAVRTAGSIMHTAPSFLDPQMPVSAALLTLLADQSPAALVGTPNRLLGVVTREQLEARLARDPASDSLKSLVDGGFIHVHPDHPIDVVVERFGHSGGLLPVVSRADVTRVMGVVRLHDIVKRIGGETAVSPPQLS